MKRTMKLESLVNISAAELEISGSVFKYMCCIISYILDKTGNRVNILFNGSPWNFLMFIKKGPELMKTQRQAG